MNNFKNLLENLLESTYVFGLLADLQSNLGMVGHSDTNGNIYNGLDNKGNRVSVYIGNNEQFKLMYKNKTLLVGDRFNENQVKKLWDSVSELVDRKMTFKKQHQL